MTSSFQPGRLHVAAFAQSKSSLSAREPLSIYDRLAQEVRPSEPDLTIDWRVDGESRNVVDGVARPALHVQAHATLPLTCQRCMGEVRVLVEVNRHVLFASDEVSAAALDDASDDDVLVLTAEFDVRALIEDELLLALPLVPRHEVCPVVVQLSAQDADFDAGQSREAHPFAGLAALRDGKSH